MAARCVDGYYVSEATHNVSKQESPQDGTEAENALSVRNVYKVFGKRPAEVIKRLKAGKKREDLTALGTAAVIDASFDVKKGSCDSSVGVTCEP